MLRLLAVSMLTLCCSMVHAFNGHNHKVVYDWNQILYTTLKNKKKPKLVKRAITKGASWHEILYRAHKENNQEIKKLAFANNASWLTILVDAHYSNNEERQNVALSQGATWNALLLCGELIDSEWLKQAAFAHNASWKTIFIRALAIENTAIMDKALEYITLQSVVYKLAKTDRVDLLRNLVKISNNSKQHKKLKPVDLKKPNQEGDTALHKACSHNSLVMALFLLRIEVPLNKQNNAGETALYRAAESGHTALVALLLKWGADITLKTSKSESAEQIAEDKGHHDVAFMIKHLQPFFRSKDKAVAVLTHKKGAHFLQYMLDNKKDYFVELSNLYYAAYKRTELPNLRYLLMSLDIYLDENFTYEAYNETVKSYTKE